MTTVLKIGGNGSGTIEHSMVFTPAALAQLKQFASFAGGAGQTFDPMSEQQARDLASVIGEGVTYVSSRPVTTSTGQGRDATYAFTDVNLLKISTQPPAPAGLPVRPAGLDAGSGETITFALTREPTGNVVLHIHVPEPNWFDSLAKATASGQLGMIKTLLAGAHILLAAEPAGTLVGSSSPYSDGRRVILLEVDVDQVFKDETLLPRLQAATTIDELKTIIKDVPAALKINLEREITIEFKPGP